MPSRNNSVEFADPNLGVANFALIAKECLRPVRSLSEEEDDQKQAIALIWKAAWQQAQKDAMDAKTVMFGASGHHLCLVFPQMVEGSFDASYLDICFDDSYKKTSELNNYYFLFLVYNGLGSEQFNTRPANSQPPTQLNIRSISQSIGLEEKMIRDVLIALILQMGEKVKTYEQVQIECPPVGVFICESRFVRFELGGHKGVVPPIRALGAMVRTPRKTVSRLLSARGTPREQLVSRARGSSYQEEEPNAFVPTAPASARTDKSAKIQMLRTRAGSPRKVRSPRNRKRVSNDQPVEREEDQQEDEQEQEEGEDQESSYDEPLMTGRSLVNDNFEPVLPPLSAQFPPTIDEFSRTLAAPFSEHRGHVPVTRRIGSHYCPLVSHLMLDPHQNRLIWDMKSLIACQQEWKRPSAVASVKIDIDEVFKNRKVLAHSPVNDDVRAAGISLRQFYECMFRYDYYRLHRTPSHVVAPIRAEWIENVGYLLNAQVFVKDEFDMSVENVDLLLQNMHKEVVDCYTEAVQTAIVNYIFKDPAQRKRAGVLFVPHDVPDWGSVPHVGIEGTTGGPPMAWRDGIEKQRKQIASKLTTCSQSSLQLLDLWFREYDEIRLVNLPEPGNESLFDIDTFFRLQSEHRENTKTRFEQIWSEDVLSILRLEKEHINSPRSAGFYGGINALVASQTRSTVQRSITEYVVFFRRFANTTPKTWENIIQLQEVDNHEDAFLSIKLIIKEDSVHFKTPLTQVSKKLLKLYRDFVLSLKDLVRPDAKFTKKLSEEQRSCLWEVSFEEEFVQNAGLEIEEIVRLNVSNVEESLRMYDQYIHLLTEADRVSEFTADLTKSRADYRAEAARLLETEISIRDNCPNAIRMQMISVDCQELNEALCAKAAQARKELLRSVVDRNRDRNHRLVKNFENVVNKIGKKPTNEVELVDLESSLEQFRMVDHKTLVDEFVEIKSWQDLIFETKFVLTTLDFKAIHESALWVQSIDKTMNQREADLRRERETLENKFKMHRTKFIEDLNAYIAVVKKFKDAGNMRQMDEYLERTLALKEKFERAKFDAEKLNEKELLLGWDSSEFEQLNQGLTMLEPYQKLWTLAYEFTKAHQQWTRGPLFQLNPDAVDEEANTMWVTSQGLNTFFLEKEQPIPASAAEHIRKQLDAFKQNLGLVHALCNTGLRPRHWEEISNVVGFAIEPDPSFTLSRVIDMDVGKHIEQLQQISEAATKEFQIERSLENQFEEWKPLVCDFKPWRDTGTFIISASTIDDVQSLLDDHVVKTQTMRGTPFSKPFERRISEWESFLKVVQDVIETWSKVQEKWVDLENVFSSEDILRQLQKEGQLFSDVDLLFKTIITKCTSDPMAFAVFKQDGLLQNLKECEDNLELVQRGLDDYLERKRMLFPRFFFLSNDNLLEILSETKDPRRIQHHLSKAFHGIHSVDFSPDNKIISMSSSQKEKVEFTGAGVDTTAARGAVEVWFGQLEQTMVDSVRDVFFRAQNDYPDRILVEWLQSWCGQAATLGYQIAWASDVMTCLASEEVIDSLETLDEKMENTLFDLTESLRGHASNALMRSNFSSFITIFLHCKSIVAHLVYNKVDTSNHFCWVSQLFYYLDNNPEKNQKDVHVKMANYILPYGYEYLGNVSRLVMSPLTDRCYRMMAGAVHHQYGVSVEGTNGVGKTETVKDFGRALARLTVVYNCAQGVTPSTISNFFKGVAASGSWVCLDEANLMSVNLLSTMAQQLTSIQNALRAQVNDFEFDGLAMKIVQTCNCFLTLNPDSGASSSNTLPTNFSVCFRSVSMVVPDYSYIVEAKLYSMAFVECAKLAHKIIMIFKLLSETLPIHFHMHYGLHAFLSVLQSANEQRIKHPVRPEPAIILSALSDVISPKILAKDQPLVELIMAEIFPNVTVPKIDTTEITKKISQTLADQQLQTEPYILNKITQVFQQQISRTSLMLVGNAFSGKTTALNVLQQSWGEFNVSIDGHLPVPANARNGVTHEASGVVFQSRVNPRACPYNTLFGSFNEDNVWHDGIVPVIFRDFGKRKHNEVKWLVFDGPVDPVWGETVNSVLDNNRCLCLHNGEILALPACTRIMFETLELSHASPATVSRNGIVYFETDSLGYNYLLARLQLELPTFLDEDENAEIVGMVQWLLPPLLKQLKTNWQTVAPIQEQVVVKTFLKFLFYMLNKDLSNNLCRQSMEQKQYLTVLDSYVLFALIWTVGTVVTSDFRKLFSDTMRRLLSGQYADVRAFRKISLFPERGSPFEFKFDWESCSWRDWLESFVPTIPNASLPFQEVLVDTPAAQRYKYMMRFCLDTNTPFLIAGPASSGKSCLVKHFMQNLDGSKNSFVNLMLASNTCCTEVQDIIDSKMERRRKGVYGPPVGKTCIIFVDDLNLPKKDVHNVQAPLELLRMLLDKTAYAPHGGWYDRNESSLSFRSIPDTNLFSAMSVRPQEGHNICPRYLSHMCLNSVLDMNDDSFSRIFTKVLDQQLIQNKYPEEIMNLSDALIAGILDVYRDMCKFALPTPSKTHYMFSLNDFTRVVKGLLLVLPEQCDDTAAHIRLWAHEMLRVFGDRLIDEREHLHLLHTMREACFKAFDQSFDDVFSHLDNNGDMKVDTLSEINDLYFGDLLAAQGSIRRPYQEIRNSSELKDRMWEHIERYNFLTTGKWLNLVMFKYAIEHVSNIARCLKANSSMLLLGAGPTGRRSLTKLAAFMGGYETFSITADTNPKYDFKLWREDMKTMLKQAGAKMQPTVFLLPDNLITDERFLADVNSILSKGEISNLFNQDEKLALCECVRAAGTLSSKKLDASPAELFDHFVDQCRTLLSVVLVFDMDKKANSLTASWSKYLRAYPYILKNCTVDYFSPWPVEALHAVANGFLTNLNLCPGEELSSAKNAFLPEEKKEVVQEENETSQDGEDDESEEKPKVIVEKQDPALVMLIEKNNGMITFVQDACVKFHASSQDVVRKYQGLGKGQRYSLTPSPAHFIQLLSLFTRLYQKHWLKLETLRYQFETAISKLIGTESSVTQLTIEQVNLEPMLKDKRKEVIESADVLEEQKGKVEFNKQVLTGVEKELEAAVARVTELTDEIATNWKEAKPQFDSAQAALMQMSNKEMSEFKSLKNPPLPVKLVFTAICHLKGLKAIRVKNPDTGRMEDDFWPATIKMISDAGLLTSLQTFDKDNIKPEAIKKVSALTVTEDFQPDRVEKVSRVALALCQWVRAIEKYDTVLRIVRPKQEVLEGLQSEQRAAEEKLSDQQKDFNEVQDRFNELANQYQNLLDEQNSLEDQVAQCESKLKRSEMLTVAVGNEKLYWQDRSDKIKKQISDLTGDILIASGLMAYSGPLNPDYRSTLMDKFFLHATTSGIPTSRQFSLSRCLGNAVEISEWHLQNLPKDDYAVDNGVMMSSSDQYPYLIDPQNVAVHWIKSREGDKDLKCIHFGDSDFMRIVESCVSLGHPLLIENVGNVLDPILDVLLYKQTLTKNGNKVIRFTDSVIDYHNDFRMYLTTRMANPQLSYETVDKVNVINFAITKSSLQDVLLDKILSREMVEVSNERNKVSSSLASSERQIFENESSILSIFSSNDSNILDSAEGISTIISSKQSLNEAKSKQKISFDHYQELEQKTEVYKTLSHCCSQFFFVTDELSRVNHMYQFSLKSFFDIFAASSSSTAAPTQSRNIEDIKARVKVIQDVFMASLYKNVAACVFAKHQLLVSFMLCSRLLLAKNTIRLDEYNFLLSGQIIVSEEDETEQTDDENEKGSLPPRPANWVSDKCWSEILTLAKLKVEAWSNLEEIFTKEVYKFKQIYDSDTPYSLLSEGANRDDELPTLRWKLNDFQKLLLIRCLRPDCLLASIRMFIEKQFGATMTETPVFDFNSLCTDAATAPQVPCILMLGNDSYDPYHSLKKFVTESGKELKTISIGSKTMEQIDSVVQEGVEHGHWVLLQNIHLGEGKAWVEKLSSVLVNTESDDTVHPSFKLWLTSRPYDTFPTHLLQLSTKTAFEEPLGLRNSILRSYQDLDVDLETDGTNETFSKLLYCLTFFHAVCQERSRHDGWTTPYSFSQEDLRVSISYMKMMLESYSSTPFEILQGVIGSCYYSGKISYEEDKHLVLEILNQYVCEEVLQKDHVFVQNHSSYRVPNELLQVDIALDTNITKLTYNVGKTKSQNKCIS